MLIAMAVIVLVVAGAVWLSLRVGANPGRVSLKGLSDESTATVGLAGVFPAEDDAPLANPLGIVTDGELLYVAESDAGRVRVFDDRGGVVGDIVLPKADERSAVYPSSIALVGRDRLAVVDNAASRVIVVSTEPAEPAEVVLTLGGTSGTGQPTSIAFAEDEYYVFDSAAGVVHVYDSGGELARTIGGDLEPRLAFAGGMSVLGDSLYVADSNGGRVIEMDRSTGKQLGVFEDRYTLPRSVVALDADRIAVVDTFERAVHLTSADGRRVDRIHAETVPHGPLASPRGAAWLSDAGRLYVTDASTGRVVVYNVRVQ